MIDFATYMAGVHNLSEGRCDPYLLALHFAIANAQPIEAVFMCDEVIRFKFVNGTLRVWDDGQSCCENRYMTTDDDLPSFVGAKLVSFDIVDAANVDTEYDVHEQTFVKLETTAGTITLVSHNEHNGYYGGINVVSDWDPHNG